MFEIFKRRPKCRLAIGAIFRNEREYLLEWVAWHQSQGVEKFIIYDNESDDGTLELLKELDKHSIIDLYSIRRGEKAQIKAYERILSDYNDSAELVTFIDADEFLMPQGEDQAVETIYALFSDKNVGALAINWRIYGTSGHIKQTDGLVVDRFTMAALDNHVRNHYIKSVYRPDIVKDVFCHRAVLKKGWRYINTEASEVDFATLDGGVIPIKSGGTSGMTCRVCSSGLRVNHYAIKSQEEFIKKKKYRGDAILGMAHVKSDGYYKEFNQNDVYVPVHEAHYERFIRCYKILLDKIGIS